MTNSIVIYSSKYGTTKKYAQWLAEELDCEFFDYKKVKTKDLLKYDNIIYGGALYAGGVSGIKFLIKSFESIKDKRIVLFTCGLSDPNNEENINNITNNLYKVITSEMKEKIKVFHLRGGIDYSKLGFIHKTMMSMLVNTIKDKPIEELNSESKEMLETYGKVVDFTDKTTIEPIVSYVRS